MLVGPSIRILFFIEAVSLLVKRQRLTANKGSEFSVIHAFLLISRLNTLIFPVNFMLRIFFLHSYITEYSILSKFRDEID